MSFGFQLLKWRLAKGLSQAVLAERAGFYRPYLSRLERDEVDPSLSTLRKLSGALGIHLGELLEGKPDSPSLSRAELDNLARAILRPGKKALSDSRVRSLSKAFQKKRQALGLYKPRMWAGRAPPAIQGEVALRRWRAELGDKQWQALLSKIQKHSSLGVRFENPGHRELF